MDLPYSLMAELNKVASKGNPPVHLWHPENEKDIDLVIRRDGAWHYLGTPIERPRLVRLFASVLRRDPNGYYLVTPVEKCRITVEDVPFLVVLMNVEGKGRGQRLQFTTNMGETLTADEEHPLRIQKDGDQWVPYVMVRGGMEARLNRNVYYRIADLLVEENRAMGLWSCDIFFPLMLSTDAR